jgi:hypothetical protein
MFRRASVSRLWGLGVDENISLLKFFFAYREYSITLFIFEVVFFVAMDIDLDFFSVLATVSGLSAVCPLGVTLASRRGHNLRDPRVEGMLQVASEPLYLFARVDKAILIAKLAERRIRVLAGEDDGVLSSQGLLKVDVEVL